MNHGKKSSFLFLFLFLWVAMAPAREPIQVEVKRKPSDSEWRVRDTVTLDLLDEFQPKSENVPLTKYGGRAEGKVESTGFFHTRKIDGRWRLIDPEGALFYTVGLNSTRPPKAGNGRKLLKQRFGSTEKWADETTKLFRANSFNTFGCWSSGSNLREVSNPLPYTTNWNFMSSYGRKRGGTYQQSGHRGYPNDCIFVFDPEFESFCDEHAEKLLETKDDPYLLGHFSDNEMPLRKDLLDRYQQLPEVDPGYLATMDWLANRSGRGSGAEITDEDRDAFLEHVVSRYFRIVSAAIKKYDPNHLYLGARFHGRAVRERAVFRGAGPYVDVVSVNLYRVWTPDSEVMDRRLEWSGKPFIVTEWYAKGMDSGMPNNSGAGWTVKTQEDRGHFYQNFALALLAHPGCVGWHWHRYQDNDPTDTSVDPSNTDSNKGIVDVRFEAYAPLLASMRELNRQVYSLIDHFQSIDDNSKGRSQP